MEQLVQQFDTIQIETPEDILLKIEDDNYYHEWERIVYLWFLGRIRGETTSILIYLSFFAFCSSSFIIFLFSTRIFVFLSFCFLFSFVCFY